MEESSTLADILHPQFKSEYQARGLKYGSSHQYKRFEMVDLIIIFGVFFTGFIFSMVLTNYYRAKREKLEEINKQFKGLKGDYEQAQVNLENIFKWKYRAKIMEKMYYILLMSLAFICYKSPSLFTYFFSEIPQLSIPLLCFSFFGFNFLTMWLDKRSKDQDKKNKKLRDKLKDAKRNLISHMDPLVVETLKEIVKKDLKHEI
jgi:hypothetical protein